MPILDSLPDESGNGMVPIDSPQPTINISDSSPRQPKGQILDDLPVEDLSQREKIGLNDGSVLNAPMGLTGPQVNFLHGVQNKKDSPDEYVGMHKVSGVLEKVSGWLNSTNPTREPAYGLRADGTAKSAGFLGPLKRPDGDISTELSIGVNIDGKETEIPSLVPTLSQPEIDSLLKGDKPSPEIVSKATEHAKQRMAEGKNVFAQTGELPVAKNIIDDISGYLDSTNPGFQTTDSEVKKSFDVGGKYITYALAGLDRELLSDPKYEEISKRKGQEIADIQKTYNTAYQMSPFVRKVLEQGPLVAAAVTTIPFSGPISAAAVFGGVSSGAAYNDYLTKNPDDKLGAATYATAQGAVMAATVYMGSTLSVAAAAETNVFSKFVKEGLALVAPGIYLGAGSTGISNFAGLTNDSTLKAAQETAALFYVTGMPSVMLHSRLIQAGIPEKNVTKLVNHLEENKEAGQQALAEGLKEIAKNQDHPINQAAQEGTKAQAEEVKQGWEAGTLDPALYTDSRYLGANHEEAMKQATIQKNETGIDKGESISEPVSKPPEEIPNEFGPEYAKAAATQRPSLLKKTYGAVKKGAGQAVLFLDKWKGSTSTRLGNISPKLKARYKDLDIIPAIKTNEFAERNLPLLEKTLNLPDSEAHQLDLAMMNGDENVIMKIAERNNMVEEVKKLRTELDSINEQLNAAGIKTAYREGYYPRLVRDHEGLVDYILKSKDKNIYQKEIDAAQKRLERDLTTEEKAGLINKMISDRTIAQRADITPGSSKSRAIDNITDEMRQFYASSDEALRQYVQKSHEAIASAKLLKGKGDLNTSIDDSIGKYILDEMAAGNMTPTEAKVVKDILQARLKEGRMNEYISVAKNLTLAATMGQVGNSLKQLGDLSFSLMRNGWFGLPTGSIGKALVKSLVGKSEVTSKDIGVDKILQEFEDGTASSRLVNTIFSAAGFNKIVRFGKETFINSTLDTFRNEAANPSEEFKSQMETIFEDEAPQLIKDLQDGEITFNVKRLLAHDFMELQPMAKSEMPEYWLRFPNGRMLYTLESYTNKILDIYRNQVYNEIKTGIKSNDKAQILGGLGNFVKLTAILTISGATTDKLIDLVLGKAADFGGLVAKNLIQISGLNQYDMVTYKRGGLGMVVLTKVAPPMRLFDLADQIVNRDDRVVKSVPVVGSAYYYWFGGGSPSGKKEKKKEQAKERKKKSRERKLKELKGEND